MRRSTLIISLFLSTVGLAVTAQAATVEQASVARTAPQTLTITWKDSDPVDVYQLSSESQPLDQGVKISARDADGRHTLAQVDNGHPIFALRDSKTGATAYVAERVLPLERGSNFRDIGGYPAADGKHVRWGMIFRSGASPMLSEADVARIHALGLQNLVDLRSNEERVVAQTKIDGVPYNAVGYSMVNLIGDGGAETSMTRMESVYRNFPKLLAPQMRVLFRTLARGAAPLAYNCSAGQDRTGFATGLILTTLGVPRDVILQDYLMSTALRHPEYEMPYIDPQTSANNKVASYFAKNFNDPELAVPKPLKAEDGTPYLVWALDEINSKWGSVDAYLTQEVGVTPAELAEIRATYLK